MTARTAGQLTDADLGREVTVELRGTLVDLSERDEWVIVRVPAGGEFMITGADTPVHVHDDRKPEDTCTCEDDESCSVCQWDARALADEQKRDDREPEVQVTEWRVNGTPCGSRERALRIAAERGVIAEERAVTTSSWRSIDREPDGEEVRRG